jgi:hypothetical protein
VQFGRADPGQLGVEAGVPCRLPLS